MNPAALLQDLGINQTIYLQFVLFVMAYVPLHFLLFKPYFTAYSERINRTEGNQKTSERLLDEAQDLRVRYENKSKELNSQFKAVYDEEKTLTMREYDQITAKAREKAKSLIDESKRLVEEKLQNSKQDIKAEVQNISETIVAKVLN